MSEAAHWAEPQIEINEQRVTTAMAMTLRVAIESFASTLLSEGLGDDEHGVKMKESYLSRINEIRELMRIDEVMG